MFLASECCEEKKVFSHTRIWYITYPKIVFECLLSSRCYPGNLRAVSITLHCCCLQISGSQDDLHNIYTNFWSRIYIQKYHRNLVYEDVVAVLRSSCYDWHQNFGAAVNCSRDHSNGAGCKQFMSRRNTSTFLGNFAIALCMAPIFAIRAFRGRNKTKNEAAKLSCRRARGSCWEGALYLAEGSKLENKSACMTTTVSL